MNLFVVNWRRNNAISPNSTDFKVMFSFKHLIGLVLTSLLFVSCSPSPPYQGVPNPNSPQAQQVAKTAEELKKEEDLRKARVKANKEAKARREAVRKTEEVTEGGGSTTTGGGGEEIKTAPREPVKRPSKYRTAMSIPGKPGFVFNPWTNKAVDVRGIPSGQLIRDPNDGDPEHKFRVP